MSITQMLENGKLAMAIDGSWALSWLYKIKAPLGTAVLPKMKSPGTSVQAHLHSALKATKNPDAAWNGCASCRPRSIRPSSARSACGCPARRR